MQEQVGSANETNPLDWPAWAKAWGGLVAIAFLNGVLHRLTRGRSGNRAPISFRRLCCWRCSSRGRSGPNAGIPSPHGQLPCKVGLMWSSASVAFEFLFGQYVIKDSWSKLLHAYNLLDGRLWLVDVLGIAAGRGRGPGLANPSQQASGQVGLLQRYPR
jgi:hypothetical protein